MGPLAFSLPLASSAFCLSCSNAAWVFKYLKRVWSNTFRWKRSLIYMSIGVSLLVYGSTSMLPCTWETFTNQSRRQLFISPALCNLGRWTLQTWLLFGTGKNSTELGSDWDFDLWYFEDHDSHLILVVRHHLGAENLCMAGEKLNNHLVCLPTIHLQLISGDCL